MLDLCPCMTNYPMYDLLMPDLFSFPIYVCLACSSSCHPCTTCADLTPYMHLPSLITSTSSSVIRCPSFSAYMQLFMPFETPYLSVVWLDEFCNDVAFSTVSQGESILTSPFIWQKNSCFFLLKFFLHLPSIFPLKASEYPPVNKSMGGKQFLSSFV